jgi:two-component system, LytTR family, response regulator LytT
MMHILIAEDELPSRNELRYMLNDIEPDAVFFEAADGETALKIVEQEPIDLVFLDIHMPGMDGLTAATTIIEKPEPPLIVFATAYDEHALKAFELATMDYIVKPFDERRLEKTMKRARLLLKEREALENRQSNTREFLQNTSPLTRIWAQESSKDWVLVDFSRILFVEANAGKVYVHTASNEHLLVRQTLKDLELRLASHQFLRVHKAYIVNLDRVSEVAPLFSGTFVIRMDDAAKTKVPLARSYVNQFKKLTGWAE